jgi:uncharacterized membrane protein YqhA
MAQGSIAMLVAIYNAATNSTLLKSSIVEVLTAVDSILLGSGLLVIAYGLDELFIDTDIYVRAWLR